MRCLGAFVLDKRLSFGAVLLATLAVAGCGAFKTTSILAPAPNLYTFETGGEYPAEKVPDGLRQTTTEILYVTDRNPERGKTGELASYGSDRSDSMAFGASLVEYGQLETWAELVARTQDSDRRALTRLNSVHLHEIARFPETPLPFERQGTQLRTLPAVEQSYWDSANEMRREIGERLREHDLDRVLIYVHGVNNEFQDSVGALANIWHYTGRQSLPIAYSWPAGNQGLLQYFRDVESGDFSVFHVKEFLRILASVPEVRQIDILAHSRGNAVMTDALRELMIEAKASGRDPQKVMKTGMLMMAAPDLDVGVARQRLIAERFAQAFEQINIYANPNDGALRLSTLIGDVTRLGNATGDNFRMEELESLTRAGNVNFILAEDSTSDLGHSYFRDNPAVMSDIVLALRSRQAAGSAFRPLEHLESNVWLLHPNYPGEELPDELDFSGPDR